MREQVEQGRKEMHQRFNLVDERLAAIHAALVSGLGNLSQQLSDHQDENRRHFGALHAELRNQHLMLADLYPLTVDRSKAILDSILGIKLGGCLRRRAQNTQLIEGAEFEQCVAAIRALALDGELENRQIRPPVSPKHFAHINEYPDTATSVVAEAFHRYQPPEAAPRAPLGGSVGPKSWIYIARAHDEFLMDWPEHRNRLVEPYPPYVEKMRQYRTQLQALIEAISHDLVHHAVSERDGQTGRGTAIGALIKEIRESARVVRKAIWKQRRAIRKERRRYYQRHEYDVSDLSKPKSKYDKPKYDVLDLSKPAGMWQRLPRNALPWIWNKRVSFDYDGSACTNDDWETIWKRSGDWVVKEGDTSSTLAYWLYPDAPGDEEADKWDHRYHHLDALVLGVLRKTPPAIQSLLAVGIGRMEVCVIGNNRKSPNPILYKTAEENRPEKGAYYKARFEGRVLFSVRWRGKCAGKTFQLRARGFAGPEVRIRFRIFPQEGSRRAYHRVEWIFGENNRDIPTYRLMKEGFSTSRRKVREEMKYWTQEIEEETRCNETYRRRFASRRASWSATHITNHTAVREAVSAYNDRVTVANAYLRAWIELALHDATQWSDIVTALATGNARFPQWEDAAPANDDESVFDQYDRIEQRIAVLEALIKSDELAEMAREHAGYAGLTDTVYDSLDSDHPLVLEAHRQQMLDASANLQILWQNAPH